jgi:FtsP/CotA-like multicopper oxidase with cupredoxin domain
MALHLAGHDLHVLAWDGLTLRAPDAVDEILLSSGNRVELLVKAGAPGSYDLVLTPGSSQHPVTRGMAHGPATPTGAPVPSSELQVRPILTVEVVGQGPAMALPAALPAWDPPILPIARRRRVTYTVERDPNNEFVDFGIDGAPFDPARPPYRIKLGTAEEWTVTNGVDNKLAEHAHVLHIHVNPFRVTKINGQALDVPLWRDTFVLTGSTGDSITLESNFVDFTGRFVQHCHVLSHEDLGMMEAIEVVP